MTRVRRIFAAIALCTLLVIICVLFIDRPVEQLIAAHQHYRRLFQIMAAPSLLALPFSLVFLASYAIAAPFTWPPGPATQKYLAISLATLAATAIKDELKWFFGRPWPDSWLKYGLYSFQPFTDDRLYGAFPSGHTAYIAAPLIALCYTTPKYKPLWLAIIATVMIGLVGAGYHYIGDTIAGLFVGLAAATGTMALMPKGRG